MQSKKPPQKEWPQFIRFAVVGIINTTVDFLVYTVLLYYGVSIYGAQTASYAAGTLNSYILNRSWTFESRSRFFSAQMLKFVAVNVATWMLSLLALKLLTLFFPMECMLFGKNVVPLLIKLPVVVITLLANYVLSRTWVFRPDSKREGHHGG